MKEIVSGLFVAVLLISNLLSSAKLIDIGGVVFDAGTLVFPVAYIFGDILTEVFGFRFARRVILVGFAANLLLAGFTALASALPGEALWQQYAGDAAYSSILGGVYGLVAASLAAYLVGSLSNSYVMHVLRHTRWLPVRTIGSTIVGQALDTAIFFGIATVLGVFPLELFWSLVGFNYVFKVAIEVAGTPITVLVIRIIRHMEHALQR